MQMDAGLDTGAICLQQAVDISASDTLGSLHDKLAILGGELIVEALEQAASGTLTAHAQAAEGVTYASKISRSEAQIDFFETAEQIERKVRAFNPAPGAWFLWQDKPVKVWHAEVLVDGGMPGKVLCADEQGIVIACGQGALRVTELQMSGGKKQTAAQWLAGHTAPDGLNL
jgi:methionyl-tRNA formyltransferase